MGFVRNIYEPRMFFIQHQSRNFIYCTWCIGLDVLSDTPSFTSESVLMQFSSILEGRGEGIRKTKLVCIYLMLYLPVFDNLTTFTQQHKPNIFAATRPKGDLYPILHTQALISNISHLLNC